MNVTKSFLVLLVIMGCAQIAYSQYYYNDIVALQQSGRQYKALKANGIRKVTATSYERDNQPTEGFTLQQILSEDARTITITSGYATATNTITVNTYQNNRLVKTKDSTDRVVTTITYKYDSNNKLGSLTTQTDDAFMNSHSTEVHAWTYNGDLPTQMLKIKDNSDTTFITFVYDDNNNVGQETLKRKGVVTENYYYYYDAAKNLTDVVRFNARANKMLPDFLFDYDAQGRLVQLTQVPAGRSNYTTWKYTYNDKGLKEKELLYSKQQQLIGRVEYTYQ